MRTVQIKMNSQDLENEAVQFFGARGYHPANKVGQMITFEGGKDWGILQFLIWFALGIIPGIAYLALCRNKLLTLQIIKTGTNSTVNINAITNRTGGDVFAFEDYLKKKSSA